MQFTAQQSKQYSFRPIKSFSSSQDNQLNNYNVDNKYFYGKYIHINEKKENNKISTPSRQHKQFNDITNKQHDNCRTPDISKELSSDINKTSGLKQHHRSKSHFNEPDKIVTQLNFKDININKPKSIKYNLTEQSMDNYLLNWLKETIPANQETIHQHRAILPTKNNKPVLVLDLDETLVHCITSENEQQEEIDEILTFKNQNSEIKFKLRIRPYAREFIKWTSSYFEIIIFTASMEYYASQVVKCLDPNQKYISQLLCREHCIHIDNLYIKDLRVLKDRCLDNILIVDNAIQSFAWQLPNGIPIKTWKYGKNDDCLLSLYKQLKKLILLTEFKNVVLANKVTWKLNYLLDVNEWIYTGKKVEKRKGSNIENMQVDYEKLKSQI